MKKVSIIIPIYKPDKRILKRVINYLNKNKKKDYEIIRINGQGGTANAFNRGIKKARGEIVLIIHQDCIPLEKEAIQRLIKPFEDENVVSTFSWILDNDTQKKYYPSPPDIKFTAYRKKALEKVGLFDEKNFLTGGEDVDMFLKLQKIGKTVKVENAGIEHIHKGYLGNKTVEKRRQNGSINGALCRIHGIKNERWFKSLILSIIYPFSYGRYFLKAFITRKQSYRRNDK